MENKISKTLNIIGIMTIAIGIFGSLILSIKLDSDVPIIFIVGGIASFVAGMFFIGLSEIISLIQKNVDKQNEILEYVKNKKTENAPKSVIQDIEDNLPKL